MVGFPLIVEVVFALGKGMSWEGQEGYPDAWAGRRESITHWDLDENRFGLVFRGEWSPRHEEEGFLEG